MTPSEPLNNHPDNIENLNKSCILHEDSHLLAINKPAHLLVHRGMGRDKIVLADLVKTYLNGATVHTLHRLDRQTSGVVLFAKNRVVAKIMSAKFKNGEIDKTYIALVRGESPTAGRIDNPVPKSEDGKRVDAVTNFETIETAQTTPRHTSLVIAKPVTGRFHQIRRHLKHISHPIIGDANYGKGKLNRSFKKEYNLTRMALHAKSITFTHPITLLPQTIKAPLPKDLTTPLTKMGFTLK